MEAMTLICIIVLTALVSLFFSRKERKRNHLPGPTGLPLIGYLPFMTEKPYVKLQELAKIYGPVYRVQIGSHSVVVLCDFQSIKEAFASDAFMGRPHENPFELSEETIRTGAILDLPYKEQRRFSLHMLRDLGFGKTRMEEHMKDEILELLQRIQDYHESPIAVAELLTASVSNNISSLIFGKRLQADDPKRQKLNKLVNEVGRLAVALSWQIFFPWIRTLMSFCNSGNSGKLSRALSELKKFCRKEIEEHEKTLDPTNIRDYIDGYLLEIKKKADDPDTSFTRKRACPGVSLAEMEVFIYLTAILQKFDVFLPAGKVPDLEGFLGLTFQPEKQELIFKLRE